MTHIWDEVLGRHGEDVSMEDICNENGKRLLQFSSEHNLWISNTWFLHKRIYKSTPGSVEEKGSGLSLTRPGSM